MTLEEKLESFKRDRVGFHVSSREVAASNYAFFV